VHAIHNPLTGNGAAREINFREKPHPTLVFAEFVPATESFEGRAVVQRSCENRADAATRAESN
jgi:hypothetical protein